MDSPLSRRLEDAVLGLALLAVVGLFLWQEHLLAGGWGFPLDDTWIHLQFARNLSTGQGFSFNPGEPISASTAPLWTLVLAIVCLLPWDPVSTAKVVGVLLLWANGLVTARLARQLGLEGRWPLLAGLVVVAAPRLVWGSLSGMEISLYALLATSGVLLHLDSYDQGPSWGAAALFGLASLARPECVLLLPVALADRWRIGRRTGRLLRQCWLQLLVFAAILLPWVLFSMATLGRPLPNTFYAKVGPYGLLGAAANLDFVRVAKALLLYPVLQAQELGYFSLDHNLLLACLVPVGLLQMLRSRGDDRTSSWLIPLILLSYPVARGVLAPFKGAGFQHGRYAAHLVPLLTVSGLVGLRAAFQVLTHGGEPARARWMSRWGTIGAWGLVLVNLLVLDLKQAQTYGWNVQNINAMQVATGRWLAANTPAGATIATHDIGAIGYFSGRRVLDTSGLVTPQVLGYLTPGENADEGVLRFLQRERPGYLAILPTWYPWLSGRSDLFQPIHEATLGHNTICAGDRLVVYRATWASSDAPSCQLTP